MRDYLHNDLRDRRNADKDMYQIKVDSNGKEHFELDKISVYMDEAKFVPKDKVASLIDLPFSNIGVVNAVRNGCPYDKSLEIIDLKLDVMGPKEDEYYGALPYLVKNIRRGNTLIHAQDKDTGEHQYLLGRKGLMKFFDMRMSYIEKSERHLMPT